MWYVIALGNPGAKYSMTRHNIGWLATDAYCQFAGLPTPVASAAYSGRVSTGVQGEQEVTVLYPETFMNNSGSAVRKLVPTSAVAQTIVVYDDIDIPFGDIKISFGKSGGGHNGVASVVQALGSKEFVQVRVGIAPRSMLSGTVYRPQGAKQASYVLGNFSVRDRLKLGSVCDAAAQAIAEIVAKGYQSAMNTHQVSS